MAQARLRRRAGKVSGHPFRKGDVPMFRTLLRKLLNPRHQLPGNGRPRRHARPGVEQLESRWLPAPLVPGAPVSIGVPALFSGSGTAAVNTAIASFKSAIGGVNNGANAQPAIGGSRVITWDGVKLDGTDFGGGANTTVISQGKNVGIPINRFQNVGVLFETVYATSGDGFVSVNPTVAGLFPPFSPNNTFAMFNTNDIDFQFVLPSGPGTTPVPAAARGFGAVFINVEHANETSIELFHGSQSLGKFFAPVGAQGQPEFIGALFNNPIVTNVTLTLGSGVIFHFDGTTATPGDTNDATHNLVVTDDWFFPEPVPSLDMPPALEGAQGTLNAQPLFTANTNVPFNGVVATFTDLAGTGNAKSYFARINWGDGNTSNGVVTATGTTSFTVSGTNTYRGAGLFPISVEISDFAVDPNLVTVTNTARVGNANELFLLQAYQDLLQRPLDPLGLGFWEGQLNGGASRQQVVQQIEQSREFAEVRTKALFQHYLQRAADAAALSFFGNLLTSGGTLEQAEQIIATSPEYVSKRGGGTNIGTVQALFQDALGRAAGPNDVAFFNQFFANGGTLAQAVTMIFSSPEYRGHFVDVSYKHFLRRNSDPAGRAFHVGLFANGVVNGVDPEAQVVASLVGSAEYFARVQLNTVLLPAVPVDIF
jgi:Domain of unknown function (DUF4214)